MKASTAAAVLLMAARANGGYFPTFFRGSGTRRAAASQECLEETSSLFEDAAMLAAFDAVDEEIVGKATCSGLDLGKSACEVDFDTFDSSGRFAQACEALGGKSVEVNAAIDCGYSFAQIGARADQVTVNGFLFEYRGLMDCVSKDCDDDSVKEKIIATVADQASTLASDLDATCSHTIDGFFSSASGDFHISLDDAMDAAANGDEDTGSDMVRGDVPSSAQCRSLMTAAIGVPLLNMALA